MNKKPALASEAELCAAFIEQFNAQPGWTCYPETADFDILVVHEDGRQIGVEAKLKLNAKVADQILPGDWQDRYGAPGPDYRLVIVGAITEASYGISRLLEMCGVTVLEPTLRQRWREDPRGYEVDFGIRDFMARGHAWKYHLFDWNPIERCKVPIVVPDVPAGVPCPLRLTPWKEAALQVLILLSQQGFVTAKQITGLGISPTTWIRGDRAWLRKGAGAGQWVATDALPDFDKQHPAAYAALKEQAKPKPFELSS